MEQPAERQLSLVSMQESKKFVEPYLSLKLTSTSSHLMEATVTVSSQVCHVLREHTMQLYRKRARSPGMGELPVSYVEKNYSGEIADDLRTLLYRYFIVDFLYDELVSRKVHLVNEPRIASVNKTDVGMEYIFDISIGPPIRLREWKHFAFKPPRRKNYKDLDKQVDSFIKAHQERSRKKYAATVEEGDWVCFSAKVVGENHETLIPKYANIYWIKAAGQTLRHPLVDAIVSREIGETIITDQFSLTHEFADHMHSQQAFALTIMSIAKGSHLAIDALKHMFKLANKAAVHEKVIEVFSYRNDLSQRRTMIEEMFHLFFSKHRFEVPKHLALRKQKDLLTALKQRPDYHAYRKDKNFLKHVVALSEQQLKEEMLIDQIASHEKIKVDSRDISAYLNVLSDDRAREFIYFRRALDGAEDYPSPLQSSTLKQICRREKTLNYILHHLTR